MRRKKIIRNEAEEEREGWRKCLDSWLGEIKKFLFVYFITDMINIPRKGPHNERMTKDKEERNG